MVLKLLFLLYYVQKEQVLFYLESYAGLIVL